MRQLKHHGMCCHVIALVNARIYFGDPYPPVQGLPWQTLMAITKCRHCVPSLREIREAADYLGLGITCIRCELDELSANLPAMIFVKTRNDVDHAALVVEIRGHDLVLVNHRGLYEENPVQVRALGRLHIPEERLAYAISCANQL